MWTHIGAPKHFTKLASKEPQQLTFLVDGEFSSILGSGFF